MRGNVLLLILSAIWSAHFLLMSSLNKVVHPFVAGFAVRLGTLVILTAIPLCGGRIGELFRLNGAGWKLVCVGVLGFLLDATSFAGFRHSSVDTGTILLKSDILMANLITIFFYQQRFRRLDWIFTVTVLVGVFLVMGVNPFALSFRAADILFLLSALFVTLNAFLISHIQKRHGTSNQVIAYYNNAFTLVLFTLSMFGFGVAGEAGNVLAQRDALIFAGVGAATQTLIYLVYYRCLALFPVYVVKIALLLIPVFTMAFNMVLYWRVPSATHIAGAVLVLGSAFGIVYTGRSGEQKK